jgi:hypothetical protein
MTAEGRCAEPPDEAAHWTQTARLRSVGFFPTQPRPVSNLLLFFDNLRVTSGCENEQRSDTGTITVLVSRKKLKRGRGAQRPCTVKRVTPATRARGGDR